MYSRMAVSSSFTLRNTPRRNALVGELSKPAFHQIDPGTVSGREMYMKAWAPSEPLANAGRFVSAVVVHYEVNVQLRGHLSLNYIQEFPKLTRPVPAMELGNDPAGFQLERGKQRSRYMPF